MVPNSPLCLLRAGYLKIRRTLFPPSGSFAVLQSPSSCWQPGPPHSVPGTFTQGTAAVLLAPPPGWSKHAAVACSVKVCGEKVLNVVVWIFREAESDHTTGFSLNVRESTQDRTVVACARRQWHIGHHIGDCGYSSVPVFVSTKQVYSTLFTSSSHHETKP